MPQSDGPIVTSKKCSSFKTTATPKAMASSSSSPPKFHLFFKQESPFSNWHPALFVAKSNFEIKNTENKPRMFVHVEQFMMYEKARLFKDMHIADKIMKTSSPKSCKALGRKVKNFDENVWTEHAYDIVKTGVLHKFCQNMFLQRQLLETNLPFAEASPYDKIWGIGLKATDKRAQDASKWKGTNLLGKALDSVRSIILADQNNNNNNNKDDEASHDETSSIKTSSQAKRRLDFADKEDGELSNDESDDDGHCRKCKRV
jgi:ribA/ribD-fused uncharacterized protein